MQADFNWQYYPHGPLARIELGEYRVQGLDYYYTMQGWLKGVNMPDEGDPGKDGINGSRVGRDVMAFSLGYYEGDFQPILASATIPDSRDELWNRLVEQYSYKGLYNGNIAWMETDLPGLDENNSTRGLQAMLYRYDQLNRLVLSRSLTNYTAGSGFAARTTNPAAYDESYSYDANGNLLTLQRHDQQARLKDNYTYAYYTGTNRLMSISDPVIDTIYYDEKTYNTSPLKSDGKVYRKITVEGNASLSSGQSALLQANESIKMILSERYKELCEKVINDILPLYQYISSRFSP